MKAWIGGGSNLGNRRQNLETAFTLVRHLSVNHAMKISPVFENPALLPPQCTEEWNLPFLNLVAQIDFEGSAPQLLAELQRIETTCGRLSHQHWAPRPIDLDILVFGDDTIATQNLQIPHPQMTKRPFVLEPFKWLDSSFPIPFANGSTVLQLARMHHQRLPMWMQIVNVTGDSFSDGGIIRDSNDFSTILQQAERNSVHIIDIGAESTRPGASEVDPATEWTALQEYIAVFNHFYAGKLVKPLLSIDTRNASTARQALRVGADIINDVSGLSSPDMVELISETGCYYVLMHSLTVPANPAVNLPIQSDPVTMICDWLEGKLEVLLQKGVELNRIIFDPGIGFGKTANQSLEIIRRFDEFKKYPVHLLAGHSRKSFMKSFSSPQAQERDYETLGLSLGLISKGADIIRVHNSAIHSQTFRGLAHSF